MEPVVFCTTALKRDDQVLTAMLINCCLWWHLRSFWKLVIVTFGDDNILQAHLRQALSVCIEVGCVILCSGGSKGLDVAKSTTEHLDMPSWMPRLPCEALPGGSLAFSSTLSMPLLQYWHASVAKNTSHMAALYTCGETCCLVNLDCDQLVPPEYVSAVIELWKKHANTPGFCGKCHKTDGPLTGRLVCRAADFIYLQGYDEDGTPPSGGQDVDLRSRLGFLGEKFGKSVKDSQIEIPGKDICGCALPNDFQNTAAAHDRGWAKVKNCSQADLDSWGKGLSSDKYWIAMNDKGWKTIYKPRLQKKQNGMVRNEEIFKQKIHLGAWFLVTSRRTRGKLIAAEVPRPPGLSESLVTMQVDDDVVMEPERMPSVQEAIDLGRATGLGITVVVVPAKELMYLRKTYFTHLGLLDVMCFHEQHIILVWSSMTCV